MNSCEWCGIEFLPVKSHAGRKKKYCAELCRREADKAKKRCKTFRIGNESRRTLNGRLSNHAFSNERREQKRQSLEFKRKKWKEDMLRRNGSVENYLAKQKRRDGEADFKIMLNLEKERALPEQVAVDAWNTWLRSAPEWWRNAYWKAKGCPWRDPCLSDSDRYKLRYRLDESFQIKERLRRQFAKRAKRDGIAENIRRALRRGGNSPTVQRALGYTIADFKSHIERQFTRGMTWEKFLSGDIHIDHIVPQADFDLSKECEWRRCWCLSNLRPIWAKDNLKKGDSRVFLI